MRILIALVFLLFPIHSYASVVINEVMYDLEGTDSDREWLELKNTGSDSVNLSGWKFYENNSNHSLSIHSGQETVAPGDFAVIVDSPETFLVDWPGFSGNLFDSSWSSFSNSGEAFSIKNEDGDTVDDFTYIPEDGANGDGNSLQLISGAFLPASPTPGEENQNSSNQAENQEVQTETQTGGEVAQNQSISTFGIPDRVVAGETVTFKPELYGNYGDKLFQSKLIWSFGNGATREDSYVREFEHTYMYPGSYVIVLEVHNGFIKPEPDHMYRQTIQVLAANVGLSVYESSVGIKNKSVYELDLDGWSLVFKDKTFEIPKNTIVLPGKEIILPGNILSGDLSSVRLKNESGTVISSFQEKIPEKVVQKKRVIAPAQTAPASAPVEKIIEAPEIKPETQLASAVAAVSESDGGNTWVWVYILLVLSVIGGIAYIYFRNEDDFIEEINHTDADDYTILE
jgi:hypothetical protein